MKQSLTPCPGNLLYNSWQRTKRQHPDTMVLVRTSDSYITYREDASTLVELYDDAPLILSTKEDGEVVMKSYFPRHALQNVLLKLIGSGRRVTFCD